MNKEEVNMLKGMKINLGGWMIDLHIYINIIFTKLKSNFINSVTCI